MKLTLGLTAALAGCVSAAQQAADVYIFSGAGSSASSSPSVPPSLARLLLLQRLTPTGKGPSTAEIPESADIESVVALLNSHGAPAQSPFAEVQAMTPSQLVIMLEGLTDEQIAETGDALNIKRAFSISTPPSTAANDKLVKNDFYNAGITNEHKCSIKEVTNPFEERCWSGRSTVAKYNAQKGSTILSDLVDQASNLANLARSGEMETTVVLLPASGSTKKWSEGSQELRRRQLVTEQVISASEEEPSQSEAPTSDNDESTIFYVSTGSIPACFSSEESCMTTTGNCSGHGSCSNKYAKPDGSEGKETCYTCHCLSTVNDETGSLTHWAGAACSKTDISVPFWLFAGFTIAMLGILSLSVGMLYSVGEEKMPGVLGAGVSKSG